MPPGKTAKPLPPAIARKARALVFKAAKRYDVPPAYVVAHIQSPAAHQARLYVWRVMIVDMGILRTQVARMFWRHERRLRKSVLGF